MMPDAERMIVAQAALDLAAADDGLEIIGAPRGGTTRQGGGSTFRKIDMAAKQGKLISLSWGDLMVMLPRPLYERVLAYVADAEQPSRAEALAAVLERGLPPCSA